MAARLQSVAFGSGPVQLEPVYCGIGGVGRRKNPCFEHDAQVRRSEALQSRGSKEGLNILYY